MCDHNYYAMKHFSHFIKAGFQRIQVKFGTNPNSINKNFCNTFVEDTTYPEVCISAYKKTVNDVIEQVVIVIINCSEDTEKWLDFSILNLPYSGYKTFRFYRSFREGNNITYFLQDSSVTIEPGTTGEIGFSIPPQAIYTLYWDGRPQ